MRSSSDRLLLERAQHFEADALAEIFDCYNAGIYRYALRLLGDPELARECMSETFSRFLHALRRGAGPNDYLQAYLYRIAHNWVTDYYRSKIPPSLPLDPSLRSDPAKDPPQVLADELELQQVRSALALLTPDQRQVIALKYLEEWENEEIARAMQKPVGAVKSLHHRAIASLRRVLGRAGEVGDETN
jgi:RNA polymerase sigma-70 factor (ECF subfamily)